MVSAPSGSTNAKVSAIGEVGSNRSWRGAAARRLLRVLVTTVSLCVAYGQDVRADTPQDVPYSQRGADSCLACHDDDTTLGVFTNVHGNPKHLRGPFGPDQLQCEACHGPGGAHAGRVRRGQVRPAVERFEARQADAVRTQNGACLTCHERDLHAGWFGSGHDTDDVACVDCHAIHVSKDPMTTRNRQAQVCFGCHAEQRAASRKPFTHSQDDGKVDCESCHRIHRSEGDALLVRSTTNQTCYQCHAEKRGPVVWEHAPVVEDCALCHDAHGSNHPGMLVQRTPFLCQACHSEAGHPGIATDGGDLAGAAAPSQYILGQNCMSCHSQVHGSNHPSGSRLMR